MIAEFASAVMIPAHESNYSAADRKPADIQNLVVHVTYGQALAARSAKRLQKPLSPSTSFHFVIGQAGEICQAVLIKDIAKHAHDANRTSIGIEHCARPPGTFSKDDPGLPITAAMLDSSAKLAAHLLARCHLAVNRHVIQGHAEIDKKTSHTGCPNALWDWDRYMAMVLAEYQAIDAATV